MPRIDMDALEDEWEDEIGRDGRSGRRAVKYSPAAQERIDEHEVGRVVGVDRGHVDILFEGEAMTARYAGSMRRTRVVVADRVRVRPPKHETDVARVVDRLPRDTILQRSGDDLEDDERVVVANADQVAIVIAADHLERGAGFLDRVLVAASVGGIDPVVVINRIDLVDDRSEVEVVRARYEAIGLPVVVTSAVTEEGVDVLLQRLSGSWTAFTGHSGVGKSSLFNVLVPDAEREVGEMGRRGGRHTTVASRALPVPGLDAWLIDTPGVRSFGLGALTALDVANHVPELRGLDCALDDCLHDGEPGCRIGEAPIAPERLASYRRLLGAVRGDDPYDDAEGSA